MAYTAALILAATPIRFNKLHNTKVRSDATLSSSTCSASSISSTESATEQNIQKFSYSRASPTVRWPHLKLTDNDKAPRTQSVEVLEDVDSVEQSQLLEYLGLEVESQTLNSTDSTDVALEMLGKPSRTKAKKMTKLALKRAKDWRQRVQFLMNKILQLQPEEFVADVLDNRSVQMTPTDFCYVVKSVGQSNWQRALEVYEWLNLQHWYSPNARMLATILSVLGKANEEALAVEIFTRAEPSVGNTVQVYNAMMGVYARNGRFLKVQELIDLMPERGCEPDLVSYNTLINARAKSGSLPPGSAVGILNEVRKSGLRPDVVTYNTLISACYKGSTLEEALKIYEDMESHKCQSDIWTYNSMISVYGQCGMAVKAEQLYKDLGSKGFFPDLVTYNALLSAFAREGNVVKVKEIYKEMVDAGFARDAMAYNTIINMYGKQGQHDLALQTYIDMQSLGCIPDAVTYTVLINSLGKAGRIAEAANVMSEMLAAGVKPTVRTFSALICGYAKAGMRVEAEETFHCMLRSGVKPDHLAYLVMLDIFVRSSDVKKAMGLYKEMVHYDFRPEEDLYQALLNLLMKERKEEEVDRVIKDMELHGMIPEVICTLLVKGECYDHAAKMLKLAATQGCEPDSKNLLPILSSYSSSGRHTEAYALLDSLREHAPRSHNSLTEALIILLCEDHKLDAAMEEYRKAKAIHGCNWSCTVYESLIHCCNEAGLLTECSQLYSDMKFCGVELSFKIFKSLINIYCKLGFPETSHYLVDHAESLGFSFDDFSVYVDLIEVYGKLTLLERAESLVGRLRLHHSMVDRKVWNALIHAYAANGCYEKARAVFNVMIRDGPSPTVDSINGLLQALIIDGRLDELYVVIQELQDMDFKISKSSIILMLDAFARAGNIFEVKKIYHGMKAAGYFPTMHLYRSMIGLFSRGKRVRDVESMVSEMEEAGFKPDLQIYNSLLKLYTAIEDFRKTAEVYLELQASGLKPDAETYNTLILMYSRDRRPEEGLSLLCEMKKQGMDLKLDTFKSLISACGKQQLWEQAEELFEDLRLKGLKLDRSFYHMMLKIYRDSGSYSKAENVLVMMKEADLEPSIATMHLLMVSYGSAGQPREAEKVLNNLKTSGLSLSTLPYSSVIDAYLKNRDYHLGIEKLSEMREDGMEPDHRIWTCFIRAASLSQVTSEAMILLNSLRDTGFDLPIRLLTEKAETLVAEVDNFLLQLVPLEDNAAFNFVNALEDLLWAFERRATASWLFQLAIKRQVYRHDIFRVSEKDWGADFRKLSPGAALVGLTLWLDHMQDASLQGSPESPKSVVLITGTAEYNMVSLNKTLKAYLWEMGSPFLPCKTRTGLLVAKGHSLRMWLKDSPFCLDLELKDAPSLPESNSVQLSEGCFMRSCLVPVFNEIHERLGKVRPKKFARLALLSDEKREKVIRADLQGRKEKLEKLKKRGEFMSSMKKMSFGKRKFIRKRTNPDRLEEQVKR